MLGTPITRMGQGEHQEDCVGGGGRVEVDDEIDKLWRLDRARVLIKTPRNRMDLA